jgi:hypothetical protein
LRYKRGEYASPDAYFKMLDDHQAEKLFLQALMKRDDFDKIAEALDEYLQTQQVMPDTRADLDEYVNKNCQADPDLEVIIDLFESTEHAKFVQDVCRYLILRQESKTNSILIWGAPNAGKTQYLERLGQIFKVLNYKQTRGNFDCRYKGGKMAPNFILCDEGCLGKLFDPKDQYVNAKLFLEGQGLMVEQKMRNPKQRWRGVPVILTANNLPPVMKEPTQGPDEEVWHFSQRKYNYGAFKSRCKITKMERSHSNTDRFPYTAEQLALYMQHLCNRMEPVVEEEVFSEASVEQLVFEKRAIPREEAEAAGFDVAPDYEQLSIKHDADSDLPA